MKNHIKISIILATYNWDRALDIILDNLQRQIKNRDNIEIVIADDGSNADTIKVIKKYQAQSSQIKHVWHEDMGFRKPVILNRAVAESKGDYLIFLDGDCIPFPDYINEHLNLEEKGYFIAGNRVLLSQKFTQHILDNPCIVNNIIKWRLFNWIIAKLFKSVNKIFPRIKLNSGKLSQWRYRGGTNWRYPKGCNFALHREAFIAVNGFDESFSGWGHEDSDLFVRLLHLGVRIKNGRFAIPVLHLWHKEYDRGNSKINWGKLMQHVEDENYIKAQSGIDKYLN
ncbi:MAG: glycosyltransferase [Neisseriaceae bacterium]